MVDFLSVAAGIFSVVRIFLWRAISLSLLGTTYTKGCISSLLGAFVLAGCNIPTLGYHYITECYDDQSCQMEVIASTRAIEGYFGVQLASCILFHHHNLFHTAWPWFRCIPTISVILSYFGL